MKYINSLTLITLFITITLAFISCDDDGYSLDKFWYEVGTIEKNSEHDYKIVLDKGPVLFPSASNVPVRSLENDMRVFVDFTILEDGTPGANIDYYVKVNGVEKFLTKPVISYKVEISDSLGMDPIELPEYWIANDFITFRFFYGGGDKMHMVNLAKHDGLTEDGKSVLEFRHNAYEYPKKDSKYGYVTFPLKETFSEVTDSIQLQVRYKGFDKDKTIDITYRPRK